MTAYLREKEENLGIDVLGRSQRERRGRLGIGLSGAATRYNGDLSRPQSRAGAELSLRYQAANPKLAAIVNVGRFELGAGNFYRETFNYLEACGQYRLFQQDRFTPYLLAGGGATTRASESATRSALGHLAAGVGAEYLPTDRLGLNIGVEGRYFFTDGLDRIVLGKYNDSYLSVKAGVVFYFGHNPARSK